MPTTHTAATSTPHTTLDAMGGIRAASLQVSAITQVSRIMAPDIASDGDLIISASDASYVQFLGGVQGETRVTALEIGAYDGAALLHGTSIAERVSVGELISSLRLKPVGGVALEDKIYAIRSMGTEGHIIWQEAATHPGDLDVTGSALIQVDLSVSHDAFIGGATIMNDAVVMQNALSVGGAAYLAGVLSVSGTTYVSSLSAGSTIDASGAARLASTLSVSGATYVSTLSTSSSLNVAGAAHLESILSVSGVAYAASGVSVGGSLDVDGATRLAGARVSSTLSVGSAATFASNVVVQGDLTVTGTTITASDVVVKDKTLTLNEDGTTNASAELGGLVLNASSLNSEATRSITYTSMPSRGMTTGSTQLSAFEMSDDLLLGTKTRFSEAIAAGDEKLSTSPRSKALHLGNIEADHWIIVADIASSKLQFWFGTDIADDEDIATNSLATLAFEINAPL